MRHLDDAGRVTDRRLIMETEISAMTFGPYGVGRLDGRTLMVPNAVPGDRLEVTVEAERRDYLLGRIARVVRASPERREPPCRFLPRCGGCDWQQINYSAQLALKAGLVAMEFSRALGLELERHQLIEPAPEEFGYRARVRLKVDRVGRLGFHELGSNALVPIDRCLVAAPGLRLPFALARELGGRCSEIEVVSDRGGEVLIADLTRTPDASTIAAVRKLAEADPAIQGIVLRTGTTREVVGDPTITIELEPGCVIEAAADLFSQVNRAQNQRLIAAVLELAAIGPGGAVLDLFCGAGNFSLPAARRGARVNGVDTDSLAIAAAEKNARRLALAETQFAAMKAVETARFLARAHYRPEVVIMDPPRTGAAALMEPVARLRARSVIYVSCDPATLVRDLQLLVVHGYRVDRVRGFDFFPNTHHVELVVHAVLT